jgi:hypothetical protein
MIDLLRLIGAFIVGALAFYVTTTYGAAGGFALVAFLVVMLETRLNGIARAIDGNFGAMRHMQRWTDE